MENLEETINALSVNLLLLATVVLIVLAFISLKIKKPKEGTKKVLFTGIAAAIIIPTIYMIISTLYLNLISSSRGPVHWHADIEIWACGTEVNLKDPIGWSNKIGTPILHEHNDKRIHMEGVVVRPIDASLGRFFNVIGGGLTPTAMWVPTNNGMVSIQNGNNCLAGVPGELQVFVYQTDKDEYYAQQKLTNPQDYIISPDMNVPAGDCIIVEFDSPKSRTDKICRSYSVAEQIGKLKGEKNSY